MDEQLEEGQLLGQYVYQEDGDALQTYPVTVREAHSMLKPYLDGIQFAWGPGVVSYFTGAPL